MTARRHVVVGNGGAAVSAIESIRRLAPQDEIVSISRENCSAYSPVLTVYYLTGRIPYRSMFIRGADFYQRMKVIKRWGQAAVEVDTRRQEVVLADGARATYDTLLMATGSTPVRPRIPGADLPGVFTLWTAQDALKLRHGLAHAQRVAVVGAGMIGLQVINAMVSLGKQVAVIELMDRPAAQVVDEVASRLVAERLAGRGAKLYLGERLAEIVEEGKHRRLRLASGKDLLADAVVMSAGVRSNTELARGSGIAVAQGVLVDEGCRTNVTNVFAAGDVAQSPDLLTGQNAVQATWPNAIEQGMVAGTNMAGRPATRLRHCRSNVFSVQGLACASAGVVSGSGDGWSEQATRTGDRYRKLVFRDGCLAGAVLVGDVSEAGALVGLIEKQLGNAPAAGSEVGWTGLSQAWGWRWT